MSALLPEAWIPDPQDTFTPSRRPCQWTPGTDILVWTECYALMVVVLTEKQPQIVHAARSLQGITHAAYDRLYHHQALAH